jgi:hypothetical protein
MGLPPRWGKIAAVLGFLMGTGMLVNGAERWITGSLLLWRGYAGEATPAAWEWVLPGALWMVAGNLYLFQNSRRAWSAMLALTVASIWYLGVAAPLAAVQLALLGLAFPRRERRLP